MSRLKMVSPWIDYYHKLQAFFKEDTDVTVVIEDEDENEIKLYVDNERKADALTEMLPKKKTFGSITVKITVIFSDDKFSKMYRPTPYSSGRSSPSRRVYAGPNPNMHPAVELIYSAFMGNGAFCFVDRVSLQTNDIVYAVFKNEVVQYYNDDIGDYYGQCSTLYQYLANDIFKEIPCVHYCTDKPQKYDNECF